MANIYETLELLNPQGHLHFDEQFRPPSSTDDGKKLRITKVGAYTFEVRRHPFPVGTSVTIEGIVGNDAVVKEVKVTYLPRREGWQIGYVSKFRRELCRGQPQEQTEEITSALHQPV